MMKRYLLFTIFWYSFIPLSIAQTSVDEAIQDSLSDCNCSGLSNLTFRLFNAEGARFTLLPKISPILHSEPILLDANENLVNSTYDLSWVGGVRLFRYAPNAIFSYGIEANYLSKQFTINDNYHTGFRTNELEIAPFINLKTGDFTKNFHFSIDVGVGFNRVLSSKALFFDKERKNESNIGLFQKDKFNFSIGGGLVFDVFNKGWKRIGQFSLLATYTSPIRADFFSDTPNFDNNPIINEYRYYSTLWKYFSISIGQTFDIKKNKNQYRQYKFNESQITEGGGDAKVISKNKFSDFLLLPVNYEKRKSNLFGGFNFVIRYQPTIDSINYDFDGLEFSESFRDNYSYSIGYNLHWGNYGKRNSSKLGLFLGGRLSDRFYNIEGLSNRRFRVLSGDLILGLRAGLESGVYLFGNINLGFNLSKSGKVSNPNRRFEEIFTTYEVGLSFRNLFSLSVETNPLSNFSTNMKRLKLLDYKLSVGF